MSGERLQDHWSSGLLLLLFCCCCFLLKIYIVVQVKTRLWRVHTIYVLDIKKIENNVSPLTTYSFTNFKVGVRGATSHGHVYMITFRFGHIYI